MKVGLNTYSIRKSASTLDGFAQAMGSIAEMGIKHIELAVDYLKFPFDAIRAAAIKDVLDSFGIQAVSCQIKQARMQHDFDCCLKALRVLDVHSITNTSIDTACLKGGEQGIIAYAEQLEKYRLKLEANGLFVAHHNRHYECLKYNGKTVFDIMSGHFGGNFVLDTYWLAVGGVDPVGLLMKLNDRVRRIHLRDFKLKQTLFGLKPTDTEVGAGNIDFAYICFKAAKYGVEYGLIQQDVKAELQSVQQSYQNACLAVGRGI